MRDYIDFVQRVISALVSISMAGIVAAGIALAAFLP